VGTKTIAGSSHEKHNAESQPVNGRAQHWTVEDNVQIVSWMFAIALASWAFRADEYGQHIQNGRFKVGRRRILGRSRGGDHD
jgi:hypothetical protein